MLYIMFQWKAKKDLFLALMVNFPESHGWMDELADGWVEKFFVSRSYYFFVVLLSEHIVFRYIPV